MATPQGFEPRLAVLETVVLPLTLGIHLVEGQGVEPCDRITTVYGLAIRCITVLPALHYSLK